MSSMPSAMPSWNAWSRSSATSPTYLARSRYVRELAEVDRIGRDHLAMLVGRQDRSDYATVGSLTMPGHLSPRRRWRDPREAPTPVENSWKGGGSPTGGKQGGIDSLKHQQACPALLTETPGVITTLYRRLRLFAQDAHSPGGDSADRCTASPCSLTAGSKGLNPIVPMIVGPGCRISLRTPVGIIRKSAL
jgi:hypothetical protein